MKVLLLAGGESHEREVSLNTGKAICAILSKLGHNVEAFDPASGQPLLTSDGRFIAPSAGKTGENLPLVSSPPALAGMLESSGLRQVDIVFIALHGGSGENGSIQNLLDLADIPYTGSNMTASAVAMDKAISKRLFASENILTPEWALYRIPSGNVDNNIYEQIQNRFNFPIIVKPNDAGSTIGLSKVDSEGGLQAALQKALAESHNILVEKYIPGREVTVSILDDRTFPVVEIKPNNGLYDYEAKYTHGMSEYVVPADLPSALAVQIQEAARKAFDVVGASGLVRVDFILAPDDRFYCLELNTLPGMTDLSLAPMAARADGIEFAQLVEQIIQSGLKKPRRHRNINNHG